MKLVFRNGISFQPKYIGRFLFLFYCSTLTSIFSAMERLLYRKKINQMACPDNPIIIIGHWRSGTTFLHQLLNQSPDLTAPSLFQVGTPECFLISRKFLMPHIVPFLTKKRSVDNVAIGLDEPQEDEYALFRMTTVSPVEELIFPKRSSFFLNDISTYLPDYNHEPFWREALITLVKKLAYESGKKIVLKNPFHSMRISYLKKLFPKVKFVHIYRNPLDTIPSTMHMWNIVGQQNTLRKEFTPPSLENSIEIYDKMLWKIRRDFVDIPQNDYCEIGFEELEQQPVEAIKRICRMIDIPFSKTYRENIESFLKKIDKYKKNSYRLLKYEKDYIKRNLKHHMKYYGYYDNMKGSKANFSNNTGSFITGILQLQNKCSNISTN
ncbi:sulfotransferase [Fibrobacterota bacterium]